MAEERLQKIISRAGLMSRREAENFILAGKVSVDGKIISELGTKADLQKNKICVEGKELTFAEKKVYILLNKPRGYISTAKDDRGRRTVLDLVTGITERIYPVGRLDYDSEGLLLLTNDGELMNKLLHPKYKIAKTYRAKILGNISQENLKKLCEGIELEDGLTAPAKFSLIGAGKNFSTVEITIHEGRNRQIRRMFAAVGHEVISLRRIKFAGVTLKNLPVGKFRSLTEEEIFSLYKKAENFGG